MQIPKMTQKRKINNFRESLKRKKSDNFDRPTYKGANGLDYVAIGGFLYQASKDGEPEYRITIGGEPVPEFYQRTIQDDWETFEARVVPKEAGDIQRSEMRMAFISGMVLTAAKTVEDPGEVMEFMDKITDEGKRYANGRPMMDIYLEEKEKNA